MADTSSDSDTLRTQKRTTGRIHQVVKCGIVGDGTVGKSCLLMTYTMAGFVEHYVPTIFDNFSVIEEFDDGKLVNITLWDTAGQDDYALFRTKTCYKNTDVFLVCFSVVSPHSFQNVKQKWVPELQEHSPGTPILLVGTQTDLKDDQKTLDDLAERGLAPISTKMGQRKAKEIKAIGYIECTAKDIKSVVSVFRTACEFLLEKDKKRLQKINKGAKKEAKYEEKVQKHIAKQEKKKQVQ